MALSFGLFRVDKTDVGFEGAFKNLDQLGSEGDFGDQKDSGFLGP